MTLSDKLVLLRTSNSDPDCKRKWQRDNPSGVPLMWMLTWVWNCSSSPANGGGITATLVLPEHFLCELEHEGSDFTPGCMSDGSACDSPVNCIESIDLVHFLSGWQFNGKSAKLNQPSSHVILQPTRRHNGHPIQGPKRWAANQKNFHTSCHCHTVLTVGLVWFFFWGGTPQVHAWCSVSATIYTHAEQWWTHTTPLWDILYSLERK